MSNPLLTQFDKDDLEAIKHLAYIAIADKQTCQEVKEKARGLLNKIS